MWSKTGLFLIDHELSFLMFMGNYSEFKERANVSAQEMHIRMETPTKGEDVLIDAVRSFYNFLMSAGTLIDHYRVATKALPAALKSAYEERVKSMFEKDLLAATVKKLRNHATHRSLPAVNLQRRDKDTGHSGSYRLLLDVRDLENWNGWNIEEASYLASLADKVDLIDLMQPYFDKTKTLYCWFMLEYANAVPEDADQLNRLYEKLQ